MTFFVIHRLDFLCYPPAPLGDLIIENSKIPYRDPPKGLGDDIVGHSRIPKKEIPRTPKKN
ncbi:MAG: hypothetical protein SOW03_03920 [Campylobacter sp.]|nr:hypothetical protein [Campylobacteraceae bacterium]MDY2635471.1 hypothetical protein [Campylobacter sp.]